MIKEANKEVEEDKAVWCKCKQRMMVVVEMNDRSCHWCSRCGRLKVSANNGKMVRWESPKVTARATLEGWL